MSLNKQRLTKSFYINHLEQTDLPYVRSALLRTDCAFFSTRWSSEIRAALTVKSDYMPTYE